MYHMYLACTYLQVEREIFFLGRGGGVEQTIGVFFWVQKYKFLISYVCSGRCIYVHVYKLREYNEQGLLERNCNFFFFFPFCN